MSVKRILLIAVPFLNVALLNLSLLVSASADAARGDSGTTNTPLNVTNLDRWEILPDMELARGHPGVAVVNDKIHVISGFNPYGSGDRNSQEVFDPQTDTWQFIEGVDITRSDFVTLNYSNTIYAIGGYKNGVVLDLNHTYDPVAETWDTENETLLPTAVSGAGGVVLNDKIFIIGGFDGISNRNIVQIYDPSNNSWDVGTPMNTARSQFVAVVLDGLVYVIGGNYQGDDAFDVEIFDPAAGLAGTWSEGTPLPERRRYMAAAVRQGKIYVMGGRNETGDFMNTLFVYDPDTKLWSTASPMPTARGACRAAVVNDTIYVIGGASDVPGAGTANEAYGALPPLIFLPMVIH